MRYVLMKKDNNFVGILSKIKGFYKSKDFNKISLFVLLPVAVIMFMAVAGSSVFGISDVSDAYCLYIDGKIEIAMRDKEDLENILENIKNSYKTQDNEVSFYSDINIKKALVEKDILKNSDETEEFLKGYKEENVIHTVKNSENIESIASKYNVSVDEILKNNPGIIPEFINEGEQLNIKTATPILKIKAVSYETKNEEITFDTKIKDDSSRYKGDTAVIEEGENGEKAVVYEIVKINNVPVERNNIKETVTKQPQTKVVVAGTKIKPKDAPTGTFSRPYSGNISSRFGSRWGRKHHGVDFEGNIGDPIYATDGGEVTFAGWDNSGYGYMVKIMHSDGYESFYAHMNEVKVTKGQKVSQNDLIGTLGNTGRSTGPHLHFEIRKDGVAHDPLNYTD